MTALSIENNLNFHFCFILFIFYVACRGMTTYDFIVFEQKKQRARSAANSAAPAAESKTGEVAEEKDVIKGDGDGSGDEEQGGGGRGVDDATETMTESERVVVDESSELHLQMQRKKQTQEQQRTVRGQPIPLPAQDLDPILELYNQQQRSLPQGRQVSPPSLPPLHPFGMGNDFIPSRVHNSESPKTGSSRGSSVISTGSAIEFYADQFAASDDYSVIEPLAEIALSGSKGANTGAHLSWNAGPKSVQQLQIGSPKNKVSVFGRKGSLIGQNRGDGENKSTGSESENDRDDNKPLPLEYPESLIPSSNGKGHQGSRVPTSKLGAERVGASKEVPKNPFTPLKMTSATGSAYVNGSGSSSGSLNGNGNSSPGKGSHSNGITNGHSSNGHSVVSKADGLMNNGMKMKVMKALLSDHQQEEEKDAQKNIPGL